MHYQNQQRKKKFKIKFQVLLKFARILPDYRLRTDTSLYLWGAKIAFYWYQIFVIDSAVIEAQKFQARMEAS